MFVGCNTLSFTGGLKSDTDAINMLAQAGFDCVDLNLNRYSVKEPVSPFWLMTVTEQQKYAAEIKKAARDAKVFISQVHAPYPTFHPTKRKRKEVFEYVENAIYITALIGAPYIVVHPQVPPESKTEEQVKQAIEDNIDFYKGFADILRQTGVKVAIENMFNWDWGLDRPLVTVASTADCMRYMLDTLNYMCGETLFVACLDTGHGMLTGGGDLPYMVRRLAHRLRLLHIHDNDGIRDRHQVPYTGIIDWDAFAAALVEIDYNGVLSLEVKVKEPDINAAKNVFLTAERLRLTVEKEKKNNELCSKKTKRT